MAKNKDTIEYLISEFPKLNSNLARQSDELSHFLNIPRLLDKHSDIAECLSTLFRLKNAILDYANSEDDLLYEVRINNEYEQSEKEKITKDIQREIQELTEVLRPLTTFASSLMNLTTLYTSNDILEQIAEIERCGSYFQTFSNSINDIHVSHRPLETIVFQSIDELDNHMESLLELARQSAIYEDILNINKTVNSQSKAMLDNVVFNPSSYSALDYGDPIKEYLENIILITSYDNPNPLEFNDYLEQINVAMDLMIDWYNNSWWQNLGANGRNLQRNLFKKKKK